MERTRPAAERGHSETDLQDARKRLGLVSWHLEEIEDALVAEHPDVAELVDDVLAEAEALDEVLDAIDRTDDRWASTEEVVHR